MKGDMNVRKLERESQAMRVVPELRVECHGWLWWFRRSAWCVRNNATVIGRFVTRPLSKL